MESDWRALAAFWYPVAFSHEVIEKPHAVRLLDERVVVYRLSDGSVAEARDICCHRGVPLSLSYVKGDEIICKYHGLRYDREGRCVCIAAHPGGAISPRLHLDMYQAQERYGLIWVRLVDNGAAPLPEMKEWDDPAYLQMLPRHRLASKLSREVRLASDRWQQGPCRERKQNLRHGGKLQGSSGQTR
jgi:phenylpropionate dioxygenase-like ring-hydroxylating dioxygenase large terminal subunit